MHCVELVGVQNERLMSAAQTFHLLHLVLRPSNSKKSQYGVGTAAQLVYEDLAYRHPTLGLIDSIRKYKVGKRGYSP